MCSSWRNNQYGQATFGIPFITFIPLVSIAISEPSSTIKTSALRLQSDLMHHLKPTLVRLGLSKRNYLN
jgi:hypothetical protein